MRKILVDLVWCHLSSLGMFKKNENTLQSLKDISGMLPVYERWLHEWIRIFEHEGYLKKNQDRIVTVAAPLIQVDELWRKWDEEKASWLKNQYLQAQIILLDKAVRALPQILVGDKMATEVIFPNSSLELVEAVYKNNPMANYFNQVLSGKVVDYVRQRLIQESDPKIRMLEIGAGTGATSVMVLDKLKDMQHAIKEYCYTDISNAFLNHAEKSYGPGNPFLTYRIFDVEAPVEGQGIDIAGFDILIAANVLHATKNIRVTLRDAKNLLKKNGLLLINEIAVNSLFNHMTFGLLKGWWLFEDPEIRIPGCPGLYADTWRHVLENEGFRSIIFPCHEAQGLEQQIIVAESDGIIRLPLNKEPSVSDQPTSITEKNSDGTGKAAARERKIGADRIELVIVDELASSLRIEKNRIDVDEPFSTYGLDSILAVNMTRVINEKLSIDMDITVMFEHGTVGQLSDFIVSTYRDQLGDVLQTENISSVSSSTGDLIEESTKSDEHILFDSGSSDIPSDTVDPRMAEFGEDIAIIGISGKFPGAADVNEFWKVIEEGRSCITRVPNHREDWKLYTNSTLSEVFNISDKWGGFLENVHEFDPLFFGIAPAEAVQMSPEQRLMLMCVWNTIEDAGYTPKTLSRNSTGVFVATGPSEYQNIKIYPELMDNPSLLSTPSLSMMPNRISYHFNLQGPSEFCDTTCSSSIVALHRAVQSIRRGECVQAIVGGVNLILSPMGFFGMEAVGMLSKNGEVHPFQDNAEGTVRSEGIAAILIKPLEKAVKDNDFIYAVVKGTGVSHGGKGVSLIAPNIQGMKTAMQHAYVEAGIDPYTVSYIEAHGMSSTLADSAEISALKSSLQAVAASGPGELAKQPHTTYISSLKPCIGHAEVVSGMAALTKVIFAMRHQLIPAIPKFTRLNSAISLSDSSLKITLENTPWDPIVDKNGSKLPRRASINSFGVGGINAHVVLEEFPVQLIRDEHGEKSGSQVILLSAKDDDSLRQRAKDFVKLMRSASALNLADVAHTLQIGREVMTHRLAVVVSSIDELIYCLEAYIKSGLIQDSNIAVKLFSNGGTIEHGGAVQTPASKFDEECVPDLLKQKNLAEIADSWVKGAFIDWPSLHEGKHVRKVPLPGYPFKQITCWNTPVNHFPMGSLDARYKKPHRETLGTVTRNADAFTLNIIGSVLGLASEAIDVNLPLEYYGLNSLLLVQVLSQIREVYPDFQSAWLQAQDSVHDIVNHLSGLNEANTILNGVAGSNRIFPELVRLNSVSQGRPIFWIHGALGSVETFRSLANRNRRPFYAIQARGFMTDHSPIEGIQAMAAYYIDIIRSVQPQGPYDIGGFCLGGVISYEMARQLQQQTQAVNSIVMVDSPDNTGFRSAANSSNIPAKNAALQVVNMLLWPAGGNDLQKIAERMIHQDELDSSLDDDEFIIELAHLATRHGLAMRHDKIVAFIKQNVNVQISYKLIDYDIQPLADADAVDCYYFRNRGGLFFGDLGGYFQIANDLFSLDNVNYWQDWQKVLTNFNMIDINPPNHMAIMSDEPSINTISDSCEKLYAADELISCLSV